MNSPQESFTSVPLASGLATLIADSSLTLLAADEGFRALWGLASQADAAKESLRQGCDPDAAEHLFSLLAGGPAHLVYEEDVLRPDKSRARLHITAVRLGAMASRTIQTTQTTQTGPDQSALLYQLSLSDVAALRPAPNPVPNLAPNPDPNQASNPDPNQASNPNPPLRPVGGNAAANAFVPSDTPGSLSFSYDFASDVMTFGSEYSEVFDGSPVLPRFREQLCDGSLSAEDVGVCFYPLFSGERLPGSEACEGAPSEWRLLTKEGLWRWFSLFCITLRDAEGVPVKTVGALRNIDRQKREQLRLIDKSRTDAMTGLCNKVTTEEEVRAALSELRPGTLGILLMIDLDNFKLVNDSLGHLAGDSVIVQFARELRRTFRKEDIIGRVGGDEFHVFMRDVDCMDIAEEKAENLCAAMHGLFADGGLHDDFSISIGIASTQGPTVYEELFRQADVALYHAKANGKNRYECYGKPSSRPCGHRNGKEMAVSESALARDNSVMVDVIDLIFSVPDMYEGIEKVLTFVGNIFRLDRISVMETSFDQRTLSITHEWTAYPEASIQACFQDVPLESFDPPGGESLGVFYCSDTSALPPEDRARLGDPAVTALLYCPIVRDGKAAAYLGFALRGKKRVWAQQEVDTLALLSKLVGEHIRQKRAARLLHENFAATRGLLNSLPFASVYVVRKQDHRIVYFNDTLRKRFLDIRLGMACHEVFCGPDCSCGFCPSILMGGKDSVNLVLTNTPFGPVADVSVASILWESREPSLVVFVTEHMLSEEEKGQQRKKDTFSRAICSAYDYVMDLDPESGKYEILATGETELSGIASSGDYDRMLSLFSDKYLEPTSRKNYLQRFALQAMRMAFSGGAASIQMDYRKLEQGGVRWKNSRAYCFALEDGKTHILTCVRDVTEQLARELRKKQDEENYLRALQSSFTEIYRIDLDTQSISCVCADHELRSDGGDVLAENIAHKARKYIHPSDRDLFSTLYNYTTIWRHAERGETLSGEYRRMTRQGRYCWVSSLVIPLSGRGRRALVLIKDISERRRLEEQRNLVEQRFSTALRNAYTEIYEIDLANDRPTKLFSGENSPLVAVDRDLSADLYAIAENLIHPDDRERIITNFQGEALRRRFASGEERVPDEYRWMGKNGNYYWVSATIVPLKPRQGYEGRKGLLLIKDITERKLQEQKERISEQYDRALRNIYEELYELDVTRDTYNIVYHSKDKYVTPSEEGRLVETLEFVADKMIHPDDKERFLDFFALDTVRKYFASGRDWMIGEFRKLWQDGSYHWASLTMFPLAFSEGGGEKYLVFIMDIESKKQAEEIAQRNILLERRRMDDERYRAIVEQTDTLVFEWWQDSGLPYVSPDIPRRFAGKYDARNVLQVWREDAIVHLEDIIKFEALLKALEDDKPNAEMTVRLQRKDGRYIWCKVAVTCLLSTAWRGKRLIGTINDVDDATRSVMALRYRAEFDTLTGIHNAQTFYSEADNLIRKSPERSYSIIRMDINRFKVINDLHGIDEGDRLLRFIATMLMEKMCKTDTCARLGGDIFYMCVARSEEAIVQLIREITEELAAYPLASRVAPSFGVCRAGSGETSVTMLCDWANMALQTIKGNYLKNYAAYDQKLRESIIEEKKIENEMHDALLGEQFIMYLQPKVHIATRRVIGAEGLVRWRQPAGNLVSPEHFVPLFEKNGFIVRLDEYIWEQACIVLRKWLDFGLRPGPLSVNVSRLHFHDIRLCEKLLDLVSDYRIPPELLELELTETAFLENAKQLGEIMRELQRHGFLFSMDDFGSGYSSLNMLKSLPINIVKIDREFLNEGVATEQGRTIIRHTIAMAHQMHMRVIAEGVEDKEQADFLLEAGCSFAQGYHYSPPLPLSDFERMAFGRVVPLHGTQRSDVQA